MANIGYNTIVNTTFEMQFCVVDCYSLNERDLMWSWLQKSTSVTDLASGHSRWIFVLHHRTELPGRSVTLWPSSRPRQHGRTNITML